MPINVLLDGAVVPVEREVFEALFEQSVANDRAGVRKALASGSIKFRALVDLSRIAEIPYPLFFAPREVVEEQLRLKTEKLMAGFSSKRQFSMNSRNRVHLPDVELIVKDLLRKQQYLKADTSLVKNPVVGILRKPGPSVSADAALLMGALDLSTADIRGTRNKGAALDLLISKLESKQILVAQSAKNYMPQQMPKRAKFSGMTVKDAKVPYIFLASGDEGEKMEPAGRKVFTLALLAVLVARRTFATVTYSSHTRDETAPREYDLTAEILMPAKDIRQANLGTLSGVRDAADLFKVTPSAVVVRARRLNILGRDDANAYLDELDAAYANASNPPMRNPLPVNALKKYNGLECSRRMLALLDSGVIKRGDFCRVMFSNRLRTNQQVNDFRAAVA